MSLSCEIPVTEEDQGDGGTEAAEVTPGGEDQDDSQPSTSDSADRPSELGTANIDSLDFGLC